MSQLLDFLAKSIGGAVSARAQVLATILCAAALLLIALGLFSIPCVMFAHNVKEYSSCVNETTQPVQEFILEAIGE